MPNHRFPCLHNSRSCATFVARVRARKFKRVYGISICEKEGEREPVASTLWRREPKEIGDPHIFVGRQMRRGVSKYKRVAGKVEGAVYGPRIREKF